MQNENVNFDKLHELVIKWNPPYSGDLPAAFPEFFPAGVIAEFRADSKNVGAFRRIFEIRGRLGEQANASLRLGRFESYTPEFSVQQGLKSATKWYFENL